jgi:CRP-like cAMP-binding protein
MLALKASLQRTAGAERPPPIAAPSPALLHDSVWPAGSAQVLERDRALYAEGGPARNWYCLLSGTVRLVRTLADGRRHIPDFVFPGQVFGFSPGLCHGDGAEAVEPSTLVSYSLIAIEQRMAQDHHARRVIRTLLAERLAAAQDRALVLGSLDASERLGAFLLAMARRSAIGARASALVAVLPMSRADIADYLGLTVETVSRIFTALRRSGAIRLATVNRVEIIDPAALAGTSGAAQVMLRGDGELPLRRCA